MNGRTDEDAERLAAEMAAADELAEIDQTSAAVEHEHAQEQAEELGRLRAERSQALHEYTTRLLDRLSKPGVLRYIESSPKLEGRSVTVLRVRPPTRGIILHFREREIRVWQRTSVLGEEIRPQDVRGIDPAAPDAEGEIQRAIRWTWEAVPSKSP